MHIAWMERGGELRNHQVKQWTWREFSQVAQRLCGGDLPKMKRGAVLVAWDDLGPEERINVVPLDDKGMSDSELEAAERMALRMFNESRSNANPALGDSAQ